MSSMHSVKRNGLIVVTGLVVAFTREGVETHWHLWDSVKSWLLSWFIHTVAIMALMMGVAAITIATRTFFFGKDAKLDVDADELLFMVCMTAIVACAAIFVLAHWVPIERDE